MKYKKINILILIIIIVIINYWYFFKLDKKLYVNIKNDNKKFNLIYNDKHPLNNFFDKVYVITLPKRKDHMINLMKTNNIDVKIFDALTPENTPKEYLYENNYISTDCILNDGRIYCHMSHITVLKDMVKNNYKNCFIFEDDIDSSDFNINNVYYIDNILKNLPNDYEIFYLGKCNDIKNKNIIVNDYILKPYKPLCRHAYGVSNEGAKKLIKYTLPMYNKPGDNLYFKLINNNILNAYSSYDQVYNQNRLKFGTNLNNVIRIVKPYSEYNNLFNINKIINNIKGESYKNLKFYNKCSVIILSYNRPHNLDYILPILNNYENINDITIGHGSKKYYKEYNYNKVINIKDFENNKIGGARRFLLYKYAKKDNILFLDDDILPSEKLVNNLLNQITINPNNIYGSYKRFCDKSGYYNINTKKIDIYNTILIGLSMVSKYSIMIYLNTFFKYHYDWFLKYKGNCEDLSFNNFIHNNGGKSIYIKGKYIELDKSNGYSSNDNHYKIRNNFCQLYF